MIKKIFVLCFMVFQLQAIDIFQAVEVNNKQTIGQWLTSKPNVNVLNEQGQSLLHVVVKSGNRKLVRVLLEKKVDINIIDSLGKTALDYAVELKHKKIVFDLAKKNAAIGLDSNLAELEKLLKNRSNKFRFLGFLFLSIGLIGSVFHSLLLSVIYGGLHINLWLGDLIVLPTAFFITARKYTKLSSENLAIIR